MSKYHHYSFDLWLTLIKSNPAFKLERTRFFYDNLNSKGKTLEEVGLIFRQIDLMCNAINEKTGKNIDADEMYLMIISNINGSDYPLCDIDTEALYNEMEAMLFKHLPVVYCDSTPKVLAHIKQNTESTINILSNTGFIRGTTLRKVLQHLEIDQYLDFQLYSDEAGMSKPNIGFFKMMLDSVSALRSNISLDKIIHIGDNPKADIEGARTVGINSLLINSNNISIHTLVS